MKKIALAKWDELEDRTPSYALVADVDLVIVRFDDSVSVLYGRCAHRGALMSDGHVAGDNLICGVHGWDYRLDTGVSEYNNSETLPKFNAWVESGEVLVDEDEIAAWAKQHPQPYQRDAYQGLFQDPTGTADEPHVKFIRKMANEGLSKVGHHGPAAAMGVSRSSLPKWEDLQFIVGQLHKLPLLDDEAVGIGGLQYPANDMPVGGTDLQQWIGSGETPEGPAPAALTEGVAGSDIFDREKVFYHDTMPEILKQFPNLKVIHEICVV